MSQPDHESIVNEIRTARIAASPELRARIRVIAASAPAAAAGSPRRELPWRRFALVLVPACVAVALAASLAIGLSGSGKGGSTNAVRQEAQPTTLAQGRAADSVAPLSAKSAGSAERSVCRGSPKNKSKCK